MKVTDIFKVIITAFLVNFLNRLFILSITCL